MASFLEQLKGGGATVDNSKGPDESGVVVRKLEKHFANESWDKLGLRIGPDAEVTGVEPGTPAHKANIPTNYCIISVNDEFIGSEADFQRVANRSTLFLTTKLHALDAVDKLINAITKEESNSSAEETRQKLKLDELARSSPRHNFLNADHPLFQRYQDRLKRQRMTLALLKQKSEEAKEASRRETERILAEAAEKMRREQQLALEKKQQQEKKTPTPPPPAPEEETTNTIPILEKIANSTNNNNSNNANSTGEIDFPGENEEEKQAPESTTSASLTAAAPEQTSEAAGEQPPAVLTSELLALVGVPVPSLTTPFPEKVEFVSLPSEEYTLSTGEKVISVLKRRTGPIPPPPPGLPPRMRTHTTSTSQK